MKRRFFSYLTIFLLVFSISACAGGGGGKGNSTLKRVQALLKDGDLSTALSNATITIMETGDSTISDAAGAFVIDVRSTASTITILVEGVNADGNSFSTEIIIENLPEAEAVLVDLIAILQPETLRFFVTTDKRFFIGNKDGELESEEQSSANEQPEVPYSPPPAETPEPQATPPENAPASQTEDAPASDSDDSEPPSEEEPLDSTPPSSDPPSDPEPTDDSAPAEEPNPVEPAPDPVDDPDPNPGDEPVAEPEPEPEPEPAPEPEPGDDLPPQPECGNGILEPGEDCDEFGRNTFECNSDCTFSFCGDGRTNPAGEEECDEAGKNTPECDEDCTRPFCGDGIVNEAAGELCDFALDPQGEFCADNCQPIIVIPPPIVALQPDGLVAVDPDGGLGGILAGFP